jgi:hypothetical protein
VVAEFPGLLREQAQIAEAQKAPSVFTATAFAARSPAPTI